MDSSSFLGTLCMCGGREKVGKSNNFKNELTMFTP
jgi:hypothetical protein